MVYYSDQKIIQRYTAGTKYFATDNLFSSSTCLNCCAAHIIGEMCSEIFVPGITSY